MNKTKKNTGLESYKLLLKQYESQYSFNFLAFNELGSVIMQLLA